MRIISASAATFLVMSAAAVGPIAAQSVPRVTTTIDDVQRGVASTTSTLGLLAFTAEQEIVEAVPAGERLGGARIARADHATAFAGAWAQEGHLGGWLSKPSDPLEVQYAPSVSLIENLYFDNALPNAATAAAAGDRVQFAMAAVPVDTPLPWDRARTDARGTLEWESTVVTQVVASTFSGASGEIDVVMFRADVVARGGDIDARSQPLQMPPLVLDLPRKYEGVPNYAGMMALGAPYLNYITDFGLVFLPTTGTIAIRAEVSGYIPEARLYSLPNGAVMKEWHIPITGVIAIDRSNSGLVPTATASLLHGGAALLVDAQGTRRVDVPAGSRLYAVPGASQLPVAHIEQPAEQEMESDTPLEAGGGIELAKAELIAAAAINHTLAEQVEIDLRTSGFRATLDPNHHGEGALALTNVLNLRARKYYADALTVPAVMVDSQVIRLDRARLTDLRVLPFRDGGGVGSGLLVGYEDFNQQVTWFSRRFKPGMFIHAVYELGDGLHAFVEHQLFHGGVPPGGRVNTNVVIRALDARPVNAWPTQYVELTERGPAALITGGTTQEQTHEFSAVLAPFSNDVAVGEHRANSDYRTSNRIFGGKVSVLQSPATLLGRTPNPDTSIAGQKVTLMQEPRPSLPASQSTLTIFRVGLANAPTRPPPAPPPLGQPCGEVLVSDTAASDSAPQQDVREAWFDADGTNLYASLRLAEVPAQALSVTGDNYAVHWRSEHDGYSARATLLATGGWRFELGDVSDGAFRRIRTINGEVQPGTNGVIRMAIPRSTLDYQNGTMLRDTAAHSFAGTTTARVDHAPKGSSPAFGLGKDYVITPCGGLPVELLSVVSRKVHRAAGTFEIDVSQSGAAGVENRTGGPAGEHTIVFKFVHPLTNAGGASVTSGTGSVSSSGVGSDAREYIVNLSGVTNAQTITVTITDVSDTAGGNSASIAASMAVLLGDTNSDRAVNSGDAQQTRNHSGQISGSHNFRSDVNLDGAINSGDAFIVRRQSGSGISP